MVCPSPLNGLALRLIQSSNASDTEPKALLYKPAGKDSNNQRSGGPWGSKCTFAAAIPPFLRAKNTEL